MTRAFRQSPLMLLILLLLFMGMGQGMSHAACQNVLCLPTEDMCLSDESVTLGEDTCPAAESHRHHQAYAPVLRSELSSVAVPQPLPAVEPTLPEPMVRAELARGIGIVCLPRAPEAQLRSWRPLLL